MGFPTTGLFQVRRRHFRKNGAGGILGFLISWPWFLPFRRSGQLGSMPRQASWPRAYFWRTYDEALFVQQQSLPLTHSLPSAEAAVPLFWSPAAAPPGEILSQQVFVSASTAAAAPLERVVVAEEIAASRQRVHSMYATRARRPAKIGLDSFDFLRDVLCMRRNSYSRHSGRKLSRPTPVVAQIHAGRPPDRRTCQARFASADTKWIFCTLSPGLWKKVSKDTLHSILLRQE